MATPTERAYESIGRAIDGRIAALQAEDAVLAGAAQRRVDIAAELVDLFAEKARVDPKRPPRPAVPPPVDLDQVSVAAGPPSRVGSSNVNPTRT